MRVSYKKNTKSCICKWECFGQHVQYPSFKTQISSFDSPLKYKTTQQPQQTPNFLNIYSHGKKILALLHFSQNIVAIKNAFIFMFIFDHSSFANCFRSLTFEGCLVPTVALRSLRRCSMGFTSGLIADHLKTFQLFVINHFWVLFEVCFGSLSCWKAHDLWQRPSFLTLGPALLSKILWQSSHFMMPFTQSRHRVSEAAKQLQNISEPSPCLTLGTVLFSLKAWFCFLETEQWCALPKSYILVSSVQRTLSHKEFCFLR